MVRTMTDLTILISLYIAIEMLKTMSNGTIAWGIKIPCGFVLGIALFVAADTIVQSFVIGYELEKLRHTIR